MSVKYKIVMMRHGETDWNKKHFLCGWFDTTLSEKGRQEAITAGKALKAEGYTFDVAHTSLLTRAQITLKIILEELGTPDVPVEKTWRLNERQYGGLTGLNKIEAAAKYGKVQMQIWRRSFNVPLPPLEIEHPYYYSIVEDPRYKDVLKLNEFPLSESLKDAYGRTLTYWNDVIVPQIKEGKRIIISAHGNSLRAIVKHLDNLSELNIIELSLPTGIPFIYELDEDMKPINSMIFLGDEEAVIKAMAGFTPAGETT